MNMYEYMSVPITSSETMYPPPGSCKYHTPKPVRNGAAHKHHDDDINCDNVIACCSWFLSTPLFRIRFWKFVLLFALVVTSGYFSSVVMFSRVEESLFVVKYNFTPKKSTDLQKARHEPYHHRKMSYLSSPWKSVDKENNINITQIMNLQIINSTIVDTTSEKINAINTGLNNSWLKAKSSNIQNFGSRELINSNVSVVANTTSLKLCPPIPPNLEGPKKVNIMSVPTLEVQEENHPELESGGRYRPSDCRARHKVGIVIPFRDRAAHLAVFLSNIHPFLQKQQIDYAIYIVEQAGSGKFNRAALLNIGFKEALKLYSYDCFIFHDIDLIPEDDRNLYTCPVQPRHMSVAINTMKYKLPYNDIFGGVSAMTVSQFKTVNGFSNKFWGWGGEDDDMSNRIKHHGFYISRYPANIARYTMISHKKNSPNPQRFKVLKDGRKRFTSDGLSSVSYKILDIKYKKLYTWFNVELTKT